MFICSMKTTVYSLFILLVTTLASCENAMDSASTIKGKWLLEKQEKDSQKPVTFKGQPTNIVLDLENNGYFLVYDTLMSDEWANTGVPRKQERARGQWTLEKDVLTLSHLSPDKNTIETYTIDQLSESQLVLSIKNKKGTVVSTYKKK